jgi:hypothetical protein
MITDNIDINTPALNDFAAERRRNLQIVVTSRFDRITAAKISFDIFMRDIVKVRKVGQTLVVTLTQGLLSEVPLQEGEKVLLEALPPNRITISREVASPANTRRIELELEVLENEKAALDSDIDFKIAQNNLNMPCEPGMDDGSIVELTLKQLTHRRDQLDVEIAKKRLELFDLGGS